MVKVILTYLLTCLLLIRLSAQEVSVKASSDKKNYKVGDYISYIITATVDEKINVLMPNIKDTLAVLPGVETVNISHPVTEEDGDKKIFTFKHILSKYDSGAVTIPSIKVRYVKGKDTLWALTNEVFFTVHTLKVDQRADIKDVKAPIKIPPNWRLIIILTIIALIIIVIGIYVYLYYRKKREIEEGTVKETYKSPHEVALEALTRLEEKKLWQQGYVKQYHSEITEIIRKYYEDRFQIPALEITTSEFLANLEKIEFSEKVKRTVSDFLNNADLVKFAKYIPLNDINEEMMKQAVDIVHSTMPGQGIEAKKSGHYVQ